MTKHLKVLFLVAVITTITMSSSIRAAEMPTLKVGYIFTTHHAPFIVAAQKGEAFASRKDLPTKSIDHQTTTSPDS